MSAYTAEWGKRLEIEKEHRRRRAMRLSLLRAGVPLFSFGWTGVGLDTP
ncbi:MAG TPA: hypothetical protein PKM46_08625 [Thermosynergistes sp.]|nr:hypothetical protein [Thermosynergistes sp.]